MLPPKLAAPYEEMEKVGGLKDANRRPGIHSLLAGI